MRFHIRDEEDRMPLTGAIFRALVAAFILILILIFACIMTYTIMKHKLKKEQEEAYQRGLAEAAAERMVDLGDGKVLTVATLKDAVTGASELVTAKYFYTDIGTYENSKTFFESDIKIPFSTDETVYSFSGVIAAGIELGSLDFEVNNEEKVIKVHFPQPKILSHELDEESFESYDVRNSVFTTTKLKDFVGLQDGLKKEQEEKLSVNSDFWETVKTNAENTVDDMIRKTAAVEEYTIRYDWRMD